MEEVLTVREVADRLRVTERTVREWLRKGKIRGQNHGGRTGWRITASDLDAFVRGETVTKNAV